LDPLTTDVVSQWVYHVLPDMAAAILAVGAMCLGLRLLISWSFRAARAGEHVA
jgi:hypothetical protein